MMKICVVDGQGGGIGSYVIKRIKEEFCERVEIIALGTNAIATAQMLKAKANRGASGENAICYTASTADIIIGPITIVLANGMMGEITPKMAEAISNSPARKWLLPLSQENVHVVGVPHTPLPRLVEMLIHDYLTDICNVSVDNS